MPTIFYDPSVRDDEIEARMLAANLLPKGAFMSGDDWNARVAHVMELRQKAVRVNEARREAQRVADQLSTDLAKTWDEYIKARQELFEAINGGADQMEDLGGKKE